jgi:hypothetical protein
MLKLFAPIILSVSRHGITALAAMLVTHGYIEASQQDSLLGSLLFLVSLALSALDKKAVEKRVEVARSLPPPDTPLPGDLKGLL